MLGDARDQALREGSLDGFESSLLAYRLNAQEETAPYLTTNVTLWPQTLAVVADPDLDGRLTDEQRDWLRQAADEAEGRSSALADADARIARGHCAAGARLAEASEAELAALEEAFAPVYADFRRTRRPASSSTRSRTLKASTPAEPALSIPADCAGEPPSDDVRALGYDPEVPERRVPLHAHQAGCDRRGARRRPGVPVDPDVVAGERELDGVRRRAGNYWVNGDQISWEWIEPFEGVFQFTFTRDDDGNLTLEPAEPMDPGDAFLMTGKPWTKIG